MRKSQAQDQGSAPGLEMPRDHHVAMTLGVPTSSGTTFTARSRRRPRCSPVSLTTRTIGDLLMAALDAKSVEDPVAVKLALLPGHVSLVRELSNGCGVLCVVGGAASTAAYATP